MSWPKYSHGSHTHICFRVLGWNKYSAATVTNIWEVFHFCTFSSADTFIQCFSLSFYTYVYTFSHAYCGFVFLVLLIWIFHFFPQQITAAFPVTQIWTEFYFLFQRSRKADLNSSVEAAELFISLTLCQLPHLCRGMFYSFISFRDLLCTCFYH